MKAPREKELFEKALFKEVSKNQQIINHPKTKPRIKAEAIAKLDGIEFVINLLAMTE